MSTPTCDRCGAPASPQRCPGDGRTHWHGGVHVKGERGRGGIENVCSDCIIDVGREWGVEHNARVADTVAERKRETTD